MIFVLRGPRDTSDDQNANLPAPGQGAGKYVELEFQVLFKGVVSDGSDKK